MSNLLVLLFFYFLSVHPLKFPQIPIYLPLPTAFHCVNTVTLILATIIRRYLTFPTWLHFISKCVFAKIAARLATTISVQAIQDKTLRTSIQQSIRSI